MWSYMRSWWDPATVAREAAMTAGRRRIEDPQGMSGTAGPGEMMTNRTEARSLIFAVHFIFYDDAVTDPSNVSLSMHPSGPSAAHDSPPKATDTKSQQHAPTSGTAPSDTASTASAAASSKAMQQSITSSLYGANVGRAQRLAMAAGNRLSAEFCHGAPPVTLRPRDPRPASFDGVAALHAFWNIEACDPETREFAARQVYASGVHDIVVVCPKRMASLRHTVTACTVTRDDRPVRWVVGAVCLISHDDDTLSATAGGSLTPGCLPGLRDGDGAAVESPAPALPIVAMHADPMGNVHSAAGTPQHQNSASVATRDGTSAPTTPQAAQELTVAGDAGATAADDFRVARELRRRDRLLRADFGDAMSEDEGPGAGAGSPDAAAQDIRPPMAPVEEKKTARVKKAKKTDGEFSDPEGEGAESDSGSDAEEIGMADLVLEAVPVNAASTNIGAVFDALRPRLAQAHRTAGRSGTGAPGSGGHTALSFGDGDHSPPSAGGGSSSEEELAHCASDGAGDGCVSSAAVLRIRNEDSLRTLLTIAANLSLSAEQPKYRSLFTGSSRFEAAISRHPAAVTVLRNLGFEGQLGGTLQVSEAAVAMFERDRERTVMALDARLADVHYGQVY